MLCRFIIEMSRDNRQFIDLDVFYATVSPMDRHGYFSFGHHRGGVPGAGGTGKTYFSEVNPNMPRTFGEQQIHISQVEALCETDVPLQEAAPAEIDEISRCIGGRIAEEVPNGATIQLGIGAIPAAVGYAGRINATWVSTPSCFLTPWWS